MSEFYIKVVRVGPLQKHPNADSLSLTKVFDYPVIVRTGEFKEGDLAVYVPVDAVVPASDERWKFLGEPKPSLNGWLIKAKKLRGVFSMGLLTHADPSWVEGQDIQELMQITKYDPPDSATLGGECEGTPGWQFWHYTDIEGLRRHPDAITKGEEVVISEKLHGASARFVFHDGRLWVGSHHQIKKQNPDILWWKIAQLYDLENKLAACPDLIFFGEVFGWVANLRYGAKPHEHFLSLFDICNLTTGKYLDFDNFFELSSKLDLPMVPVLYRGPWSDKLRELSNGKTTINNATHTREGIVIKPVMERFSEELGGRCILKLIGEDYLLQK